MAHLKEQRRTRRKMHIRKKLYGTGMRPRVYLFKSNRYVYVGVSDDVKGVVLMSARSAKNVEGSAKLGEDLGERIKKSGIEKVVFDRSGYKYHGKVKALADGIRKAGIEV